MKDLVDRLYEKSAEDGSGLDQETIALIEEAADHIEELRGEVRWLETTADLLPPN